MISDTLNSFFVNVGHDLSNKLSQVSVNCKLNSNSVINQCEKSFFLSPITRFEVEKYINNLNVNKATNSSCPHVKFLKLSVQIISPVITKIFNKYINEGIFLHH